MTHQETTTNAQQNQQTLAEAEAVKADIAFNNAKNNGTLLQAQIARSAYAERAWNTFYYD